MIEARCEDGMSTGASPTDLLVRVREVHTTKRLAGCAELLLAAEWADAHPELEPASAAERRSVQLAQHGGRMAPCVPGADTVAAREWTEFELDAQVPGFEWSCGAPFAAALGTSTQAGERLMREALFLRHRMPRIWRQVVAGEVEAFRARRVAAALFAHPEDVIDQVDRVLEPTVATIGVRGVDAAIEAALDLLHAEEREWDQLDALDAVGVTLDEETIGHTGVATLHVRADWKDLSDFNDTVGAVAAALRARAMDAGEIPEKLDVRRAAAIGWLADPARVATLLADPTCSDEELASSSRESGGLTRSVQLVVHLSPESLTGEAPGVSVDHSAVRGLLAQQVASWCSRSIHDIRVTPVIDLTAHSASSATTVTAAMAERSVLAQPTCAFPYCSRRSRKCDKDHAVAVSAGGVSCDCNLVPLCRRHHRLKTHAGWRYRRVGPQGFLWTEPHGQALLRSGDATLDLTDHAYVSLRDRPGWNGCQLDPSVA